MSQTLHQAKLWAELKTLPDFGNVEEKE